MPWSQVGTTDAWEQPRRLADPAANEAMVAEAGQTCGEGYDRNGRGGAGSRPAQARPGPQARAGDLLPRGPLGAPPANRRNARCDSGGDVPRDGVGREGGEDGPQDGDGAPRDQTGASARARCRRREAAVTGPRGSGLALPMARRHLRKAGREDRAAPAAVAAAIGCDERGRWHVQPGMRDVREAPPQGPPASPGRPSRTRSPAPARPPAAAPEAPERGRRAGAHQRGGQAQAGGGAGPPLGGGARAPGRSRRVRAGRGTGRVSPLFHGQDGRALRGRARDRPADRGARAGAPPRGQAGHGSGM
jgi:hypothetical protein